MRPGAVLTGPNDEPLLIDEIDSSFEIKGFDCEDEEINAFFRNEALEDHQMRRNTTYIFHSPGEKFVKGFITTSMGK